MFRVLYCKCSIILQLLSLLSFPFYACTVFNMIVLGYKVICMSHVSKHWTYKTECWQDQEDMKKRHNKLNALCEQYACTEDFFGWFIYRLTSDHYDSPQNVISTLNHRETLTTQVGVWLTGLQCKQKSIWKHPEQVIKVTIKSVITASSCSSWEDPAPTCNPCPAGNKLASFIVLI